MQKIKVAVLFEEKIANGGGFIQSINAALLTKEIRNKEVEFVYLSTYKENLEILKNYGLTPCFYLKNNFFKTAKTLILRFFRGTRIYQIFEKLNFFSDFEIFLKRKNVDLVYFLSLSKKGLDLSHINFIVTIWDISHLDEPEFPEIRWQSIDNIRDSIIEPVLKRSTTIIVDSMTSKKNISKRFHLNSRKIEILPHEASTFVQKYSNQIKKDFKKKVLEKYSISNPYVYYPAQFWAHKNHAFILYAIKELKEKYNTNIEAVFTGSDKGNLRYILNLAKKLNISERIKYLGFIESSEIPVLYKNSIALVMPTYFGPTNIPPIEAITLSVPIIYSDIPGAKEQLGSAAIYVDLKKVEELSIAIYKIFSNKKTRDYLIAEGRNRLKSMVSKRDRLVILEKTFKKFQFKKLTWK